MATIVFCEDDPIIQKLIRVAMRATSHTIYIAANGEEGLALIERERPDLIFTDVSMPGLDGLKLCDIVKSHHDLAHIPVILLTATVQRTQLEQAMSHGATAYLAKPFSPAELRALIDAHTHSSRTHGS